MLIFIHDIVWDKTFSVKYAREKRMIYVPGSHLLESMFLQVNVVYAYMIIIHLTGHMMFLMKKKQVENVGMH